MGSKLFLGVDSERGISLVFRIQEEKLRPFLEISSGSLRQALPEGVQELADANVFGVEVPLINGAALPYENVPVFKVWFWRVPSEVLEKLQQHNPVGDLVLLDHHQTRQSVALSPKDKRAALRIFELLSLAS